GRRPPPGSRHGRRHRLLPDVPEPGARQTALEVGGDGPETGGVQGGRIVGDVEESGRDVVAEAGERWAVEHVSSLWRARHAWSRHGRRGPSGASVSRRTAARCTNGFLCWPRNPLEFTSSPGSASR